MHMLEIQKNCEVIIEKYYLPDKDSLQRAVSQSLRTPSSAFVHHKNTPSRT